MIQIFFWMMVKPGKIENIQIFEFAPKFNFFLFSTIVQFLNFEDQAPTLKIRKHFGLLRPVHLVFA